MLKIIYLLIFLNFSLYAQEFIRKAYSEDSLIYIENIGKVGEGTIHASYKITLVNDQEELGIFKTSIYSNEKWPYLPIFTELHLIKDTINNDLYAFALGWSSFGSGHEMYTGWLIRFDFIPSVIKWFEITLPRYFPGIIYNPEDNEVYITAYKNFKENLDIDLIDFNIKFSDRKLISLYSDNIKERQINEDWTLFHNHPFGTQKKDISIDSLIIIKKITISYSQFLIN